MKLIYLTELQKLALDGEGIHWPSIKVSDLKTFLTFPDLRNIAKLTSLLCSGYNLLTEYGFTLVDALTINELSDSDLADPSYGDQINSHNVDGIVKQRAKALDAIAGSNFLIIWEDSENCSTNNADNMLYGNMRLLLLEMEKILPYKDLVNTKQMELAIRYMQ